MKLLLLQPPIEDFYDTDIRLQPIGLCYLKAAVRKYLPTVEVTIRDYHQGFSRQTISLPRELRYLREYYRYPDASPFSTFYHYYHFGADFDYIARDVLAYQPDIIGISSLFSPYYREVLRVAAVIKKQLDVPIIVGGSHVSAMPHSILENPNVDFIIRGEGERPLVEFLQAWQNKGDFTSIANLGYKKDGIPILNEIGDNYAIDELPVPDLTDLSQAQYRFQGRPMTFVITSRSCPHKCTFCSVHLTFGHRYRRRPPHDVVAEIRQRYDQGFRVFDFEDDNLTFYIKDMKQLCEQLIAAFPQKDVQFLAMNGISYLSLDSELLQLMRQAGFTHLNLALVTSDKTVRETTKRPHTIKKYLEVVDEASSLGFDIVSYQILGLPNETLESMIQTLTFAAQCPVLLGASMFYLTPNSPIAQNFPPPQEQDIFKARLTAMAIETENFCRDDIYTLFITTRIINFVKGIAIDKEQISLQTALETLSQRDHRSQIGVSLLDKLFTEKRLYSYSKGKLQPLTRFRAELFQQIWKQLPKIVTQQRKTITIAADIASIARF